MDDRVSISISEGVADVRLVRADKMNALDAAMFEALVATSDRLSRELQPRSILRLDKFRASGLGKANRPHYGQRCPSSALRVCQVTL